MISDIFGEVENRLIDLGCDEAFTNRKAVPRSGESRSILR